MCKLNNHNVDAIKYYSENPKEIRQKIMDYYKCNKDIAKKLPIKIMHGGLYKNWIKENDIKMSLDEIWEIRELCIKKLEA